MSQKPPHGYDEIVKFYGWDPEKYLVKETGLPNENWHKDHFTLLNLQLSFRLSWSPNQLVSKVLIHKKAMPAFELFFKSMIEENLWESLQPFAGCYAWRTKRSNGNLSMHAFGAAMDFSPFDNPMRNGIVSDWEVGPKPFTMPLEIVELARIAGLKWGGDFDDPMHFQYGTGY